MTGPPENDENKGREAALVCYLYDDDYVAGYK